jgi:hypothetical protein
MYNCVHALGIAALMAQSGRATRLLAGTVAAPALTAGAKGINPGNSGSLGVGCSAQGARDECGGSATRQRRLVGEQRRAL